MTETHAKKHVCPSLPPIASYALMGAGRYEALPES
jgi:hypothetical protein